MGEAGGRMGPALAGGEAVEPGTKMLEGMEVAGMEGSEKDEKPGAGNEADADRAGGAAETEPVGASPNPGGDR